jgi:adenylate cyclase class IV
LWVNVRKLGDISDDDEEVRISEILNSKKLTLHYKGEEFIVDRGSLEDMVDDIEQFLINRK